jgi:hypothetical protein
LSWFVPPQAWGNSRGQAGAWGNDIGSTNAICTTIDEMVVNEVLSNEVNEMVSNEMVSNEVNEVLVTIR